MPSPIAKYFIRALKIVKFLEIPDFSPADHISGLRGMEVPTWGYFCGNSGQPAFFFAEGGTKNRDIKNRLHKPLNDAYGQLRKQKLLCTTQPETILVGL